jgi:hypothetical protein
LLLALAATILRMLRLLQLRRLAQVHALTALVDVTVLRLALHVTAQL